MLSWDEYRKDARRWDRRASTDRGWCYAPAAWHAEHDGPGTRWVFETLPAGELACGNYCDYGPLGRQGPAVHAVAYWWSVSPGGRSSYGLGTRWCATAAEARAFIEGAVRAHLGRPAGPTE